MFGLQSGALPPGLSLFSNGAFGGVPTAAGPFTSRMKASNGIAPDAVSDPITITVSAGS